MLLLNKDGNLQPLLKEILNLKISTQQRTHLAELKFELISTIFKHEKVNAEHMGKHEFKCMVRSGGVVRTRDTKFVTAINKVAENRLKQLDLSTLMHILVLNSQQDQKLQLEVKTQSISLLKHVISERMLSMLNLQQIFQICVCLKGFSKSGFLKQSPTFLLNMVDQLIAVTKTRLAEVTNSCKPGSLKYLKQMGQMSIVLGSFLNLNVQSDALNSFILEFPEEHSPPAISLQRAEHLLKIEAAIQKKVQAMGKNLPATNSKVPKFDQLEAEFELNQLRKRAISIHNKLSSIGHKSNIRIMLETFKLLVVFEEKYGMQIGNTFKKILCHRFVQYSYQFSLKELVDHTHLILDQIKASEQQLVKVMDKFAFNEYSDIVQFEYRFRLDLKLNPSKRTYAADNPTAQQAYLNLKKLDLNPDPKKPLFKLNTMMANSMFIFIILTTRNSQLQSSIAFSSALLSLGSISPDCLTVESLYLLRKIKQLHPTAALDLEAFEQFAATHEKQLDKADLEAVDRVFEQAAARAIE